MKPEIPPPPPSENSRRRGSWKKPLAIVLTLLVLTMGALIGYDTKLQPYDDLLLKPDPNKEVTVNGFHYLYDKWSKIPKRDGEVLKRVDRIRSGLEPIDEEFLAVMRKGAENAEAELHTALEMPEWGAGRYRFGSGFISFGQLMPAVRILNMDAWVAAKKADIPAALRVAGDLHRLSAKLITENRSLIEVLVGASLQSLSAALCCDILALAPGDGMVLSEIERLWKDDPMTASAAREALLGEAAPFREAILGVNALGAGYSNPNTGRLAPLLDLLVKKNLTLNRYHALLRFVNQNMMATSVTKEDGTGARTEALGAPRMKVSANFMGDRLVGEWAKSMRMVPESVVPKSLFLSRAMRVRLALERWKTAHGGALPETLAALVPEYLPEVPADPWNGKPLLWDAKTTVIYAVGSDWIDDAPGFKDGFITSELTRPGIRVTAPAPAAPAAPAGAGSGGGK